MHKKCWKLLLAPCILQLVLLLVFWRGNEREEEAVQQKQSEEEEEEWHLRRLLRTLPNETRDRAVQTIVEKRNGLPVRCINQSSSQPWRPCVDALLVIFQQKRKKFCDDDDSSTKCKNSSAGNVTELSLCPPVFLFDSFDRCGGGREFEVLIEDDAATRVGRDVPLFVTDLHDGRYLFHLPDWIAMDGASFVRPRLRVVTVYGSGCAAMRAPPAMAYPELVGKSISSDLRPFKCSSISPFSRGASDAAALKRLASLDSSYASLAPRDVYFVGDDSVFSLMPSAPRRFAIRLSHRTGTPINVKELAQKISEEKSETYDPLVLFSNTLTDIVSEKHADDFEGLASNLDLVLGSLSDAVGARNVMVLTGPRMLPHRMVCAVKKSHVARKVCEHKVAHVSDARMRHLNDIYRAVAAANGLKVIDSYKILFGSVGEMFVWDTNWMLKRDAARDVWNYILGEIALE